MKTGSLKWMVRTALLAALSLVLMYIETPPLFGTPFLKLDLADVPAALSGLAFGPLSGVMVVLIKNLVHLLFTDSAGIGQLANFLYGSILVLSISLSSKIKLVKHTTINLLVTGAIGTVIMTIAAYFINLHVIFPMYTLFMPMEALIAFLPAVIAFNLTKGAVVTALSALLFWRIKDFLVQ
ncbi:Riboflavin transporter RibU [bioreactor metagenome]|uniref:Riboflavin transporter RibU n=1 Tax=bioreactor metagenome TaxID=1076179 RepID=A0A644YUS3_9ZZZZ